MIASRILGNFGVLEAVCSVAACVFTSATFMTSIELGGRRSSVALRARCHVEGALHRVGRLLQRLPRRARLRRPPDAAQRAEDVPDPIDRGVLAEPRHWPHVQRARLAWDG